MFWSELLVEKMPSINDLSSLRMIIDAPKRSFRAFLLDLGRKFKENDLKALKYVLKDEIPAGDMEKLLQPLDVFSALEERGLLGPDNLDCLREYLDDIDRPKMIEMLDEYEDSDTTFPLKPRSDNCLEKDGCSVSVKGGRHFDTQKGEFVEVRSGSTYSLILVNGNNQRCLVNVEIDGYEMFPNGFLFQPKQRCTLERPSREKKEFKFFAIVDAPTGSGINKWRKDKNGLIQVKFSPERADMKIICVASNWGTHVLSCSRDITDAEFLKMVSQVFYNAVVTVMINSCKPLSKRGAKLVDYDIRDGSQVFVNVGGVGGVNFKGLRCSIENVPCKKIEWRAGGTTLEDESNQEFCTRKSFPIDPNLAVSLNLRLVARENEIPLASTGNPTPLTRATLIPPPVPN